MSDIPKSLTTFLEKYPIRKLKKGWPILYQGEVPRSAFVIKKGMVKVYDISANGEEKVVSFGAEGGLVPTPWIFDKSPVSLYYYDAFTDCEIYTVPRNLLRDKLMSSEELLKYSLDIYVSLYVGTAMHVYALEQTKASDKLLRILQYLAMRFGKEVKPGIFRIDMRLTHQDLAHMIGMTRETTAVELGKLRKSKAISYSNQRYLLNMSKLQQILGEDEFKALTI